MWQRTFSFLRPCCSQQTIAFCRRCCRKKQDQHSNANIKQKHRNRTPISAGSNTRTLRTICRPMPTSWTDGRGTDEGRGASRTRLPPASAAQSRPPIASRRPWGCDPLRWRLRSAEPRRLCRGRSIRSGPKTALTPRGAGL